QPPLGFGLGPLNSNLQVFQIAPTAAYKVTDRLSVGFAPTVTLADLRADPAFITAPNLGDGFPPATHTRISWGLGFQAGLYYATDAHWNFGVAYKSPQWLEPFRFNTTD